MKEHNVLYIVLLCCAALWAVGCSRTPDEGTVLPAPAMANLDISVAFFGRVVDYTPTPAPDGENGDEYMKCLRIIIVHPDGTVEHNRLIDFEDVLYVEKVGDVKFQVVAGEEKKIYLFANEGLTTIKNIELGNTEKTLETYNFNSIEKGKPFPANTLKDYKFTLGGVTEELTGPLPMSECHSVWIPKQENYACDLFITRAAVKFSFVFDNRSGKEMMLTGLEINKLLRTEYYLPRNTVYRGPDSDGMQEITSFNVPSFEDTNNGYYSFSRKFGENGVTLSRDKQTALPPIYLLEGKYIDAAGGTGGNGPLNYSMRIQVNGVWLEQAYFPNLSQLPRNTHVKITVTIGVSDIQWTVEVVPYTEVVLDPVFGLD